MAPTSTALTKCIPMMAFPFILIVITCTYLCNADSIEESYDDLHIHREVTDRHGNFLAQKSGITKLEPIEKGMPLGRNMPTYDKGHGYRSNERSRMHRTGRQVDNRKAWLDRYKEMLTRWERNSDNSSGGNENKGNTNVETLSTPTVKETYAIPDSSSVSYLISGGEKYQSAGRNNGNLDDTLSDHKIIEGIQRLMTSTTRRSTTRHFLRSSYPSSVREPTTTPTFYQTTVKPATTTSSIISIVTSNDVFAEQGK